MEYRFPPVYFVGVMDFSIHKGSDRVMFRFNLREETSGELMTGDLQFIFLELPNCHRALTPEASVLENFCYALHNMQFLPSRPEGLEQEIFTLLFDSVEISKFTAKERAKLEKDMTTENDIKNMVAFARKKGRQEGAKDAAIEIARKFLSCGVPVEVIAKCTGLMPEEIAGLDG